MDLRLNGKTALVSGSSSGIGASIAKTLAQEGAQVLVHGRNQERVDKVVEEIKANGGTAFAALGDLTSDEGAASVVQAAMDRWGGVDILINNAAAFPLHDWKHSAASQWNDIYNANVGSVVRLTVPLIEPMRARAWGRIIQISSSGAINAPPFVPGYMASKGAMLSLTVSLSKELAKTGITVNTISPGPVETEGTENTMYEMARAQGRGQINREQAMEMFKGMAESLPVSRLGRPEEIGSLAAYLASPLSDFITGANFRVDGGYVPSTN